MLKFTAMAMKGYAVVYDNENEKIGWMRSKCDNEDFVLDGEIKLEGSQSRPHLDDSDVRKPDDKRQKRTVNF